MSLWMIMTQLHLNELTNDFSFKSATFSCWRGGRNLTSNGNQNFPTALHLMSVWVVLLPFNCTQSPSTQSRLPGHPHLKLLGKHSPKEHAGPCQRSCRTFYGIVNEKNFKTTHTHKLASKQLKLQKNHKIYFPTLICGLLTTDTHNLSSQAGFGP